MVSIGEAFGHDPIAEIFKKLCTNLVFPLHFLAPNHWILGHGDRWVSEHPNEIHALLLAVA